MVFLWIVLGVLLGRALSLVVYRMCWRHGETMPDSACSALIPFVRSPWPWLLHIVVITAMSSLSWEILSSLRWVATILTGVLAVGAVGRCGVSVKGKFFLIDRVLIIAMAVSVAYTPAMIYPALVACCALQYTVASWRLGPGYSNLLGYEFVRASLCVLVAGMSICGIAIWAGHGDGIGDHWVIVAVILYQASTYVNHAMAKSALGPRWHSWITENRIECLAANAWLRGWTLGVSREQMELRCQWIARHRRWFCSAVWLMEFSWCLVWFDARFALTVLAVTTVFHVIVFLSTGLCAYQYVVNHLMWIGLILLGHASSFFSRENLIPFILMIPLTAAWVGWVRASMFASYQRHGHAGRWNGFADAADHLMAWWDTPWMRMFSYTVETKSGKRHALPVPKFSPYDTFLTDIHTHMMILGQHAELDALVQQDRDFARTGVWGLTVHREDRDMLYRLMDASDGTEIYRSNESTSAWSIQQGEDHAAAPLADWMAACNQNISRPWFRWLMRWPHFPGEDLVPDLCPLVTEKWTSFRFDEEVASVTLWRVKTFLHSKGMCMMAHEEMGRILMDVRSKNV